MEEGYRCSLGVTCAFYSMPRAEAVLVAAPRPGRMAGYPSREGGTDSRSRWLTSPERSERGERQEPSSANDLVTGVGGKQILLDDPSGNPVELFEPTIPEAKLSSTV
jgi:hypothetical protein